MIDNKETGKFFTIDITGNKIYTSVGKIKIQRLLLKSGDTEGLDITILGAILKNEPFCNKELIRKINKIFKIRNTIAHHPSKDISNEKFENLWSEISIILITLGDLENELDKSKQ